MDKIDIEGLILTPLNRIHNPNGDILHGIKRSEAEFSSFGEAYFSIIEHNFVKAWKKHTKMTCNLLVPHGKVEFVIFDDRNANAENHCFAKICLSKENYKRLTIPPKVWFGFKGVDEENSIILNVSDMKHDPDEVQRASLDEILFNWCTNFRETSHMRVAKRNLK